VWVLSSSGGTLTRTYYTFTILTDPIEHWDENHRNKSAELAKIYWGMSRRMSNYRECDEIEKNSRTARRTRWMRGYHLLLGTLLVVTPGSDGIIPNFAPQKTSYYCNSGQRRTTAGL
jgi:hypothetical protein